MIRTILISLFLCSTAILLAQPVLPDIPALLDQHKTEFGLIPSDLAEFSISNAYTTEHLHITHVYLEQRYRDIRVFNGILNLNLMGDRLVSFGNRWINSLSIKAPSPTPDITRTICYRNDQQTTLVTTSQMQLKSAKNKTS